MAETNQCSYGEKQTHPFNEIVWPLGISLLVWASSICFCFIGYLDCLTSPFVTKKLLQMA
jgi:hypothetical protein